MRTPKKKNSQHKHYGITEIAVAIINCVKQGGMSYAKHGKHLQATNSNMCFTYSKGQMVACKIQGIVSRVNASI